MVSNLNRLKTSAKACGITALFVIALACGSADEGPVPVKDYLSLLNSLKALGANVGLRGFSAPPFFTEARGRLLNVNDEDVLVFQFGGVEGADAASKTVSADGSSIGASTMSWDAPPHFYKAGTLIVLYTGSDSGVINVLLEAMGPQFAGQ